MNRAIKNDLRSNPRKGAKIAKKICEKHMNSKKTAKNKK